MYSSVSEISEKFNISKRRVQTLCEQGIKPLDKNVIYSFLCSFKDIDLTDKLACQRLVDMFINKVVLYDNYCEIYFNTNGDKSKQLKLKEQPDIDSEILFESKKKEQSKLKSSDYSLMAGKW